MKPEVQFLAELIAEGKLPARIRQKVCDRLGEVAAFVGASPVAMPRPQIPAPAPIPAGGQAASTQKLLEKHGIPAGGDASEQLPPPPPVVRTAPLIQAPAQIDKETGRPMVATGRGSMGPRKW